MARPPRLKILLQQRHWQTYSTFCREYDRAARTIDPDLVGGWPSRAQLHRWLSGDMKGLPYPSHCRVLEAMFPGETAADLFKPWTEPEQKERPRADSPDHRLPANVRIFLDATEEDNRAIAQRIRGAKNIFFAAHTGYAAMVGQYQAAIRSALTNGARLRVVVSDPDGPLMQLPELTTRLCPSIRQAGEIQDVLYTCARHRQHLEQIGRDGDNMQARVYTGPPSMNILLVDRWLRLIPYLPLVDAAESPVYEFDFGDDGPAPLLDKYLMSIERLWNDAKPVDLAAHPLVQAA